MAKILVIDDSAVIRDLLSDCLSDCGHLVDVAANGEEGVRMALKNSYDVCVCDVHMPGMNGYDVLSAILSRKPATQLVFTDSLPDEVSEKVREAGARCVLRKPFELDHLREVVNRLLAPVKTT